MISGPKALLASKVEIISKISCSLTIICERTFELFYANINEKLDEFKTTDSKMYWKTIHMLIENERFVNTVPPLRDRDNNLSLSYDRCTI
jgi:hypothetical protein